MSNALIVNKLLGDVMSSNPRGLIISWLVDLCVSPSYNSSTRQLRMTCWPRPCVLCKRHGLLSHALDKPILSWMKPVSHVSGLSLSYIEILVCDRHIRHHLFASKRSVPPTCWNIEVKFRHLYQQPLQAFPFKDYCVSEFCPSGAAFSFSFALPFSLSGNFVFLQD